MTAPDRLGRSVAGHCPMGCGETLFAAVDGHITCRRLECPNPTAVDELLADGETEHVVDLSEDRFTIRHPLRERLDDALLDCDLHWWLVDHEVPPASPGLYRVTWRGGEIATANFQRIKRGAS